MRFLLIFLCVLHGYNSMAQSVSVEMGEPNIALNQYFEITIKANNGQISSYDKFPEIPGFQKAGTSSGSNISIINGQMSQTQSLTQRYQALKEGTYVLKGFKIRINGKQIDVEGQTIKVGPPIQVKQRRSIFDFDPWDDSQSRGQPQEFVDVKEDAFLAVSTTKDNVYVGEGFGLSVAFYISQRNQAEMAWYDVQNQVKSIIQKVTPANCWKEEFQTDLGTYQTVVINGVPHRKFILYQAICYPYNSTAIKIPAQQLKMIKYKVSKKVGFFGRDKKEDYKVFSSSPKTVRVKELPPHPLKNKVAVGDYRLEEQVNRKNLKTGESAHYTFKIVGEGNMSAIPDPEVVSDDALSFFTPNSTLSVKREDGRVFGEKRYDYDVLLQEPGTYLLKDRLQWTFFNPRTNRYETLLPSAKLVVTGESQLNQNIGSSAEDDFYRDMDGLSNEIVATSSSDKMPIFVNILLMLLVISVVVLVIKKRNG